MRRRARISSQQLLLNTTSHLGQLQLYDPARDAGAEMTVYFQENAPVVAASFARRVGAEHIYTGMAEAPVNGFVEILHKLLPKVTLSMVGKDGTIYNILPEEARQPVPAKLAAALK